jgi:hypothetical protein
MKLATLVIIALIAAPAVAETVDTSRLDAIVAEAQAVKADNRSLEDQVADSNHKLAGVDAAWQKAVDLEKASGKKALDAAHAETEAVQKKLDWYWNRPWVKAILWVRRTLYWTLGIGVGVYILAGLLGMGNPLGIAYNISQFLVRLLPFANIIRIFNPPRVTVPVTAAVTPGIVTTGAGS